MGLRHWLEPKEVNRATQSSGLGTGEGVSQDPGPLEAKWGWREEGKWWGQGWTKQPQAAG